MNHPAQPPVLWQGETPLTCQSRTIETHDCCSFTFSAPGQQFTFHPGQFISVGILIEGKTQWRAYSISSSPTDPDRLSITVKRVTGGLVSNWLLDHLQPGNSIQARSPAGEFCLRPDNIPSRLALFSAGSGITPLMSMTRWLLARNTQAEIHFFHSAKNPDNLIFGKELLELSQSCSHFHLHLSLTDAGNCSIANQGRLDATRLNTLLPTAEHTHAWLCGQTGYMDAVTQWLRDAGMPEQQIYRESFNPDQASRLADAPGFNLEIPSFGKTVTQSPGETLLDSMEREGLPIIGACRTGVCGSCKCKVERGKVESTSTLPLSPEEIAQGYVLACSSVARSDLEISL
jgi:NADH oxidoreductase Hcr